MADTIDLAIDQGTTFTVNFEVKDANNNVATLSNYTGAGQIRKQYNSNTAVSFAVTVNANGIVSAALTANQTGSLTFDRYVYDVEITSNTGVVSRIVQGTINVFPQVTR